MVQMQAEPKERLAAYHATFRDLISLSAYSIFLSLSRLVATGKLIYFLVSRHMKLVSNYVLENLNKIGMHLIQSDTSVHKARAHKNEHIKQSIKCAIQKMSK